MKRLFIVVVSFFFLIGSAYSKESVYSATQGELFSNTNSIVPHEKFLVLIKLTPQNDWHIYWDNPGDAGIATKVVLSSNIGNFKLIKQSLPKYFFLHQLITQYAYNDATYWLFEFQPNEQQLSLNTNINLRADISWQACKDECVNETLVLEKSFSVEYESKLSSDWEKEFYKAQETFPSHSAKGYFYAENDKLYVSIPHFSESLDNLRFVPYQKDFILTRSLQNFKIKDGTLIATMQKHVDVDVDVHLLSPFRAILLMPTGGWELDLEQQDHLSPLDISFLSALFMAFVGGLILNLMPCIFPILFIKAIQFIDSAYSAKKAGIEALMYLCGVLFSFSVVAGLLWFLRQSGETIGWGFQLQSPVFVAFLFILFFIIGLMFLDIIHFNSSWFNKLATLTVKNEKYNTFLTGLFAVLIASPCSAPFMGTALGYSMMQPPSVYFPIFLALALGYALPFTLITLFPQRILKILPRPGKWMTILKKIFAIPVFVTCLWLGWVFYYQIYTPSISTSANSIIWEEFTPEKSFELQSEKKPFFIDFTAKWCLTCLVNEQTTLSSQAFQKLVHQKNITLLKADWTNQNDHITEALASYNRNSVPLYIYYNGNDSEPVILPQILTPQLLEQYLK